MKLRNTLIIIAVAASSLRAGAKKPTSSISAHRKAHQEQLANAKSRIDKAVIKDFIREDVTRRENAAENVFSEENERLVDDLLKEARTHMGKRYRAGSKGPNAFDCSGFSSYVYRQFGYNLSPSSRAQYTQGTPVDTKSLRKGDLVFFTSRRSGKNVGHVGIVVSADNESGSFKFIHAAIKGGIRIDTNTGYYASRYLGARRIIED